MSDALKQDMDLLFESPAQWQAKHHATVRWTRYTMGCWPVLMGLLVLLFGLMRLASD